MATQTDFDIYAELSVLRSIYPNRPDLFEASSIIELNAQTGFYLYNFFSDLWAELVFCPDAEVTTFFRLRDALFTGDAYEVELMPTFMRQIKRALMLGLASFNVVVTPIQRKWLDCFCDYELETFLLADQDLEKYPHVRLDYSVSRDLVSAIQGAHSRH